MRTTRMLKSPWPSIELDELLLLDEGELADEVSSTSVESEWPSVDCELSLVRLTMVELDELCVLRLTSVELDDDSD